MLIVFLNPIAERGGAELVLLEMLKGLRASRPDWRLHLILGADGPVMQLAQSLGVESEVLAFPAGLGSAGETSVRKGERHRIGEIISLSTAALGAWAYRWRLGRRLRELQPDIVHSNGMKMHLLSTMALPRGSHPPLVWHFHDYIGARPLMSRLLRRASRRCQRVIANSESVAEDARRALPAGLPIQRIYNSVDQETFTPEGSRLDLDHLSGMDEAPAGTIRVGLVATFAFWKGQEIFLEAIRHLSSSASACPDPSVSACQCLRFYIIGGPVYATGGSQHSPTELEEKAKELGIADVVGFTGFVDDVPAAMRSLDIVVHASTEPEPFGLVIIQAMACGRPVISSAIGGAGELVEPEVDALTYPAGDASALAAAITRLANDQALRARLATTGRAKVERRFTRACLVEALVSLYQNLVTA